MKIGQIRFNDPKDLGDPSDICVELCMRLGLLDYARRYFERIGDKSSLERANEIRRFYKQTTEQSVFLVRAIIPDEVAYRYSEMCTRWHRKNRKERPYKIEDKVR